MISDLGDLGWLFAIVGVLGCFAWCLNIIATAVRAIFFE